MIGSLTYLHMIRATQAASLVRNVSAMRWEMTNLLSALKDAESGQRGFIITGERDYLETCSQAIKDIDQTISNLRTLTKDDPQHQQTLNEIASLIEARLHFIKEVIEVRSDQGFEAARLLIQTDRGKRLMNELRARVARAQQEKTVLLEQRIAQNKAITRRLTGLLLIGGTLSWIVLLAAFLVLKQEIRSRRKAQDALSESEERFRMLADNISQLAWMADEKGSFFWLNRRAYEYTGGVFTSLRASGWQKLVHPTELKRLIQKSDECVRTGTFFEDTVLVRARDGSYRWFLCRAIPIYGDNGRVIRWFGTATDIHELKQTQQALQESEEKFRMLAENAGAIIGIMQDARIIYANPFAETASGYTRQELYEIDIPKLIHPDYQKIMMERARRRQAGEPIESHYEFIMVRKDGEHRWLDFSPIMIYYRGKPAIIGMAFDITQRKRAEAALRESEETFRLLAENARAIIGIVQGERFIYVNPYLEELSGYTRQEILQMPIGQLVHPDSRAQVLDRARRRQAGEAVETHYEFALLTKFGQKKWLDFSVTAIHYHGRPAIVGIAIDITDRKQAEVDLQGYKNQLENKNKELESIIGIVSHDLRAPLVNIQGFSREIKTDCDTVDTLLAEVPVEQKVEMQLDKLLHKDIPESLRYILTSADAMNKLVVSLVEVARAGSMPTKREKIDMNVLIKQILQSVEIKIKRKGVSCRIDDMPNCVADKTQVEQIFRNLLDNAIKYLEPDRPGELCLGGKTEAGSALYWVADNGIGISLEHQEKIFEPYYQLKEKASGGMGMGLATVRKLVDRNHGKIWVVSEKGKGSIFYIALPKANSD